MCQEDARTSDQPMGAQYNDRMEDYVHARCREFLAYTCRSTENVSELCPDWLALTFDCQGMADTFIFRNEDLFGNVNWLNGLQNFTLVLIFFVESFKFGFQKLDTQLSFVFALCVAGKKRILNDTFNTKLPLKFQQCEFRSVCLLWHLVNKFTKFIHEFPRSDGQSVNCAVNRASL